jgi:hypothetical protein
MKGQEGGRTTQGASFPRSEPYKHLGEVEHTVMPLSVLAILAESSPKLEITRFLLENGLDLSEKGKWVTEGKDREKK